MTILAAARGQQAATTLLLVYIRKPGSGRDDAVHDCEDCDQDYNAQKAGAFE
jgi:hypothetical protein